MEESVFWLSREFHEESDIKTFRYHTIWYQGKRVRISREFFELLKSKLNNETRLAELFALYYKGVIGPTELELGILDWVHEMWKKLRFHLRAEEALLRGFTSHEKQQSFHKITAGIVALRKKNSMVILKRFRKSLEKLLEAINASLPEEDKEAFKKEMKRLKELCALHYRKTMVKEGGNYIEVQ